MFDDHDYDDFRPTRSVAVRLLRTVLIHVGIWSLLAIIFAVQMYSIESMEGRSSSFAPLLRRELVRWCAWAVPSPFVTALVRHLVSRGLRPDSLGILALVAPMAMAVRTITAVSLGAWVLPGSAPFGIRDAFLNAMRGRFGFDLFLYVSLVGLSAAWYYHQQSRARLLMASRLETQLARARLEALEAHLHPHFLFNMLHGVSSLLDTDVRQARRMIVRFSELLRMTLEVRTTPFVTLAWEIAFVERYFEIQRMRYRDRLCPEIQVDEETLQACVPRMLLQPLVENAVRHGVERSPAPVTVQVRGERRNGRLLLSVDDTGPGLDTGHPDGHGIGLETSRARLHEAYGSQASMEVVSRESGGLSVRIALPWST